MLIGIFLFYYYIWQSYILTFAIITTKRNMRKSKKSKKLILQDLALTVVKWLTGYILPM